MSERIRAYAAESAGGSLRAFEYDPGPLGAEELEITIEHCGMCHSDLSMLDNDWRNTRYPFVPGHEAVGRVTALGDATHGISLGDRVGLGWYSRTCGHCRQCIAGRQNHCENAEQTIVGRHGGYAERVRCHWSCAYPLPKNLDAASAGPLFCGGITVFGPMFELGVRPTDRVGVVGIGGLGHLALQFARAFGCEVTAFTSSAAKHEEARGLGAHRVVATHDADAMKALQRQFDFILVTSNVPLDWNGYLGLLAPRGRLHVVGAVLEPMAISAFSLIGNARSLSGSPVGSHGAVARMLEFCARHEIKPQCERFPMSKANDALDRLRSGKARYRIILDSDFAAKPA